MYKELVKRLRNHANYIIEYTESRKLFNEAADAVKELSKLIKAIPHKCECCVGCELEKSGGGCDNAFILAPTRAIEYLSKPRWIPVEERLPKGEAERYLVAADFMAHGLRVSICYYAENLEEVDEYDFDGEKRGGFYWYDGEYGYCEKIGVKYWMPLPEPPKEEI